MKTWISDHRGIVVGAASLLVAAIVFVLVWFQPQRLLFDTRVDEALPTVAAEPVATTAAPTTAVAPASAAPDPSTTSTSVAEEAVTTTTTAPPQTTTTTSTTAGPETVADNELISVGHEGTGRALLIRLPDGSYVTRFEDLDVVNGPDLRVILSASPLVEDRDAYDDGDFVDLGALKANQGNQNYEVPSDVEVDEFMTVAIWCRRFNYTFNAASITAS